MNKPPQSASFRFLESSVRPMELEQILREVKHLVCRDTRSIVANHNLHSLSCLRKNSKLRNFYELSAFNFVDGMSLIAMTKLLGHTVSRKQRVTWVDLYAPFFEQAEQQGWSLFHLGGKTSTALELHSTIRARFPQLKFSSHHGFFDTAKNSSENQYVLTQINIIQPTILLVGLGTPLGEQWILENFHDLNAKVILPVGGLAAYLTAKVATPPRWSGRWGLEWFFRFLSEPRRLFSRYFIEFWPVFFQFFIQWSLKDASCLKESPEPGS